MNLKSMPIRKLWKVLLPAGILALGFVALMLSCSSDSTTAPTEPRAWFYESEFADDPGLVARPDQVVILDIMPGEESTEHEIPYQYEEGGSYLFGIEADDPFITRAEVFDRSGGLVAATERGDGGVYLDLTPGSYSIKVYHDGSDVPEEGSVAFIRRQKVETAQPAAAVGASSKGEGISPIDPQYPAYVALQFTSGDYEFDYLAVVTTTVDVGAGYTAQFNLLKPEPIDTTGSEFKNRAHLFSFQEGTDDNHCCRVGSYPPFAGNYYFHSWQYDDKDKGPWFFYNFFKCDWRPVNCPESQNKLPLPKVTTMPQFTSKFKPPCPLSIQDLGDGTFVPWAHALYDYPCSPMYAAENGYVYFTGFSKSAGPDKFKIVDGLRVYKDAGQIKREDLKKGEVALYEGEDYTGVAVVLSASFFETTLIALGQVKSLAFGTYTDTTVQFFGETGFSDLIKTVGVNMPNVDINGSDIGSIKIFGSRKVLISSKKCPYCNLAGVDLSDLNLDNADLINANLMDASMHHSSLKKANMSNALLNGTNLTNANLLGASLYNAFLNGNKDLDLGAAILTGAYLKNTNLAGADLGGADFSNASFYSGTYNQTGCAQDPDNPGFTKNCASAQGANMNAAKFTGAYLAGADFSGTTATAADFAGAILSGATFKNAHLDWDSPTSARTDFSGTFIGGTDFTNATAEGANFENSYVNYSSNGDCMLFTVSSAHTQFPGFSYQYGDSPCVMFAYSVPTVVVGTDSNNICPDGNSGPCDQTIWTSPLIPRNQSTQPNSSCFDTTPLCDFDHIDPNW